MMKKITAIIICLAMLLCLAACGAAQDAPVQQETESADTIKVSSINELLDAIAPGANIELAEGIYYISDAKGYGGKNVSDYYYWNNLGDPSQTGLVIEAVDNLTISGTGAKIIADSRWAYVLTFQHCDGLCLNGLSLGHSENAEACNGGVVSLYNSDDVTINGCDLYGCGSVGVDAYDCYNLTVRDTDIHHCSSSAVSLSSGKNTVISGCNIYSCGTDEYRAWSLFNIWSTRGCEISGCTIRDNNAGNLFGGYYYEEALKADGLTVRGNRLDSLFSCEGSIELSGLEFFDNSVNKWFDNYYSIPSLKLDGEAVSTNELNGMFGDQLSSNGVGTAHAEIAAIDTEGTKEVHVKTADEFLKAIGSDTTIIIDGTIDLTEAKTYGEDALDEYWSPYFYNMPGDITYAWQQVYDGYTLWIGNVSNFHIEGGEIVTQPRYAHVLGFAFCNGISIANTVAGHSPEAGECAGGVIYLFSCKDAIIESCDLYGCGIYGLQTESCSYVHLQNTYIHDCSYGAAQFSTSDNVTCINTAIIACPSPAISIMGCPEFIWEDSYMDEYCDFDPAFG